MIGTAFKLKVKQVGSICDFELSWGTGQTISVDLAYPTTLTTQYATWRRAYLGYYHRLRGRKGTSGSLSKPAVDRHKELVSAEAQLLDDFQRWLLSPELVSIRREIARASRQAEAQEGWVEVFLTCTPLELARLPWETWEIGTDLGTSQRIRIARTPSNILYQPVRPLRRKARVLAIVGDDTNLSSQEHPEAFQGDKAAVASLGRIIATVRFEGWRQGEEDMEAVKQRIVRAIADERGWDILFFAGHSNEMALLGGELGIAPGATLSLRELEEPLKQAKARGLQFAIFNSCSGIDIAASLINLGLSQVAVMREPIHNQVAQEFLVPFLRSLAAYKDVGEALVDASQALKQAEKRLSYPSAYLVPSLFRHPEAELFRLQPFGIGSICQRWLPTPPEVGWLVALLLLSLVPSVQSLILEPRLLLQAAYRQVTQQLPPAAEPPVALVQIDEESLETDDVELIEGKYLDYSYLARLLDRLSASSTAVVGIDYILDRDRVQPENSRQLQQAVEVAVERGTWLVFGAGEREGESVSERIADRDRTLSGDIFFFRWYVELLPKGADCTAVCPFSYLLALTDTWHRQYPSPAALAASEKSGDLRTSLLTALPQKAEQDKQTHVLHHLRLPAIAQWFQWFHPIIDFSVPPDRAYKRISACEVLGTCGEGEPLAAATVAIVAPGGYERAGLKGRGGDNYTMPLAVAFWRDWPEEPFTGGEAHAYMLHHLLNRHLVVPIPDFWMLLLAAVVGKGITLVLLEHPRQRQRWLLGLAGATAAYGLLGLQIYISVGVLIPWFLPSVLVWNDVRLAMRRKPYGTS